MLVKNLVQLAAITSLAYGEVVWQYGSIRNETAEVTARNNHPHGLTRRAGPLEVWCGCHIGIDPTATNAVVAAISQGNTLQGTERASISLGPGEAILVSENGIAAFACNTDVNTIAILGIQFTIGVQQQVTPVCGSFIAGTIGQSSGFYYGYIHYGGESLATICQEATSSPAQYFIPADDDLQFICNNF